MHFINMITVAMAGIAGMAQATKVTPRWTVRLFNFSIGSELIYHAGRHDQSCFEPFSDP